MRKIVTILMLLAVAGAAHGQGPRGREPYAGYVYPAGGRVGATFQITAGGQYVGNVKEVRVSGRGVHVTLVDYLPPFRGLKSDQVKDLNQRLQGRIADLTGKPRPPALAGVAAMTPATPPATAATPATKPAPGPPPPGISGIKPAPPATPATPAAMENPPVLTQVDKLTLWSCRHVRTLLEANLNAKSRQQNKPAIGDTLILQVTIDADATPGDRELRLLTPQGLTNPLTFQVGRLTEIWEAEPNGRTDTATAALDPPLVLNGQIMPGDTDSFRLRLKQGQRVVIQAAARKLIPYLADAVPGWFQATMALYNATGKEVAYNDDWRYDPDPVILYQPAADGEYVLEIADSIFRGREDFVYRVTVGELPFVTEIFPLGGQAGVPTTAKLSGWNLTAMQTPLDTTPPGAPLRTLLLDGAQGSSNPVPYAVDTLPEVTETEPNDAPASAQRVTLPVTVNGRIGAAGDTDVYRIDGRAGQEIVAEVLARRLGSPLDSLLRLKDAAGKVVAWNDDAPDAEAALITHHADSYLRFTLPTTGTYSVQLSDAQQHGGEEYAYRLRLSAPRPDFALRLSPTGLNVPAGHVVAATVYALRQDGYAGDIELSLADAPPGFALSGGRIPGALDRVTVTLTGPATPLAEPVTLRLVGAGQVGAERVQRPVVPADDMMQAFAYHHLVPAYELLARVTGAGRFIPIFQPSSKEPIRLPAGGQVEVVIRAPAGRQFPALLLALQDPPPGITLGPVTATPGSLTFVLKAGEKAPAVGYANNLMVEASTEYSVKRADGTLDPNKRRASLGIMPALPFEIVP